MNSVLLVDDEKEIVRGVKNGIPWEELGIEEVLTSSSGQEALELYVRHHPDIIITDIKMPRMDGLELIREIKDISRDAKFVVLSGYDDFGFVKTAMRLGAENYLLKPLDKEEMTASIKEIMDRSSSISYREEMVNSMMIFRNNFMNRIVTDSIDSQSLEDGLEILGLDITSRFYFPAVLSFFDEKGKVCNQDFTLKYFERMQEITGNDKNCLPMMDNRGNAALIFLTENSRIDEEYIEQTVSGYLSVIDEELDIKTKISAGPVVESFREISSSYRKALLGSGRFLYARHETVNITRDIREIVPLEEFSGYLDCFKENLKNRNLTEAAENFKRALKLTEDSHGDTVGRVVDEFLFVVFDELQSSGENGDSFAGDNVSCLNLLINTRRIPVMMDKMERLIEKIGELPGFLTSGSYSRIIESVIDYITNNYSSWDISISALADKFDYHPVYLGRKFKEETGEYFSDFVNRIRLQKAEHLLKTTPMKISAIAESVGFYNTNYFFRVFKKYTGKSASEYRIV